MHTGRFELTDLQALSRFDAIIDVRSPAEFADDHLPGAVNCPVLDDTQRAEVGTLYQRSPFEARRLGAAMVAENIATHLRERFQGHGKSWHPLIYCWRGGMRSGSMVQVLRMVGWPAEQLLGGYKSYRRLVIDELDRLPRGLMFTVVSGPTGSGKSRHLQRLAEQGKQVLDLEALAAHRGSVLGDLPDAEQPSQKSFESRLHAVLVGLEGSQEVFVESESRKIGRLQLPDALMRAIRLPNKLLVMEPSIEQRVAYLLNEYGHYFEQPDLLAAHLTRLIPLRGKEQVREWLAMIEAGQWEALVRSLLERHYDPLYARARMAMALSVAAKEDAGPT